MAHLVSNHSGVARVAKVFISHSRCIFANLAFEEWLFRNHNLVKDGDALLLWSNNPAVVIGRHQNPWLEANLLFLERNGFSLARRHSGGGAVYHDLGNLNISILTEQKLHSRPENLKLIANELSQRYKIKVVPNRRDDLWLQPGERKISGTAARIARSRAYHHLTLLIDVNVPLLKETLTSPWKDRIITNATRSVSAPAIGYLAQDKKEISKDDLIEAIIASFKTRYKDCKIEELTSIDDETRFPGVKENNEMLRSWQWKYGKTPKFNVTYPYGIVQVHGGKIVECNFRNDLLNQNFPSNLNEIG